MNQSVTSETIINCDGEVVVKLADGWTLRSGAYNKDAESRVVSGDYVRLCRPSGQEYLYWDSAEWRDDPAIVMGAIINCAAGLRVDEVSASQFEDAEQEVQSDDFKTEFYKFKAENIEVINALIFEIGNPIDSVSELLDDCANDYKEMLGASAANGIEDQDDQDQAIDAASGWVTDTVSNGSLPDRIAAALLLKGLDAGARMIRELIEEGKSSNAGGAEQ